jgi:cytoskeletal protein CcmA (bactofilin family)
LNIQKLTKMFRIDKGRANSLDSQPITTLIGQEITIEGNVSGENTVKVDGKIYGNLNIKNGIVLGDKAMIVGMIETQNFVVFGQVQGNIKCKEITIKKSGIVHGDITTQTIDIELGGKINGLVTMSIQLIADKKS